MVFRMQNMIFGDLKGLLLVYLKVFYCMNLFRCIGELLIALYIFDDNVYKKYFFLDNTLLLT